jgi:hypothetical protein
MSNSDCLAGPDFLDSVADQNDAQGLPVNAAEFRQRAIEWRADQARIEQLEADLARLERERRSHADRARILDELKSHLQVAEGEDIMVNTPYDVFILPLQPSGLLSGPRFVVHVPPPLDAAIDRAMKEQA